MVESYIFFLSHFMFIDGENGAEPVVAPEVPAMPTEEATPEAPAAE